MTVHKHGLMRATAIKRLTQEIANTTQALTATQAPLAPPVVVKMNTVADALKQLRLAAPNIVINMPRVKRQWSKVLRDSNGEMIGQITEYEYEE